MKRKSVKGNLIRNGIIIPIVAAILVGLISILNISSIINRSNKKYEDTMYQNYDDTIKNQTQSVLSLLNHYYELQNEGVSEKEAQSQAKEAIRAIRYGTDDSGYFWIDDMDYTLVMHPILKEQEGTNRENLEDQNGNMIIQMIKKTCTSNDSAGFNEFWFTKSDGVTVAQKRAYSALFEPWGWFISTGNYLDDMETKISGNESDMNDVYIRVIGFIGLAAILLAIISTILALIQARNIMKPLHAIRELAGRISKGDFSTDVSIKSQNEFGETVSYLNSGQANVRVLLQNMKEVSNSLDRVIKEFVDAFNEIHCSVQEVSSTMAEIASGISVQADSTEQVNKNISSMGTEIANTAENVTEMNNQSVKMGEISNKARSTMEELQNINKKVQEYMVTVTVQTQATNDSVQRIAGAVDLINNIASQTSLLALNASIEAARAGESGKGFAVVASEIGSLSQQSAEAVNKIESIISGLIDDSTYSVEIIGNIAKEMKYQDQKLDITGIMFNELYDSVQGSLVSIEKINNMTEKISYEKESITALVETLALAAKENASGTEDANKVSASLLDIIVKISKELEQLSETSGEMDETVGKFVV